MSELYGDQYDSVAGGPDRLVPDRLRRWAGAALFLGLIGAMGTWAYDLGTRDAAEVPIIRAMEGPARVQPEEPGGLTVAHQGFDVNKMLAGEAAPLPGNAAALELPPVLLAEEDGPQGELVIAAPEPFGEAGLSAEDELRMPLQDEGTEGLVLEDGEAPAPVAAAPEATLQDAINAAMAEAETPEAEAAPAATRPLRRPSNLVAASAAAPAAASPAAAREVANPGAGARLIQLGAYDSEAITRQAWGQLVSRHGDLLGSKSLYVERTTANARVFYRLRVAGFDSTAETGAMCEALRARGIDCIPVTLQ